MSLAAEFGSRVWQQSSAAEFGSRVWQQSLAAERFNGRFWLWCVR